MKALVLEEKMKLSLRDFPIEREEVLGPRDVRIKLHTVGICGSDVHYYTHGGAGIFQVKAPMILGHEASGIVMETGAEVTSLKVGDRVCMEPGIPDPNSRATRMGLYNVDPAVRFWATPPDPRRPASDRRPSRELHLQASRQRVLRRGGDGRAARRRRPCRHQGAGQAGRHRAGDRRRADRPGHRAVGAGGRLRAGLRHRMSTRPSSSSQRSSAPITPDQCRAGRISPRRSSPPPTAGASEIVFECSGSPRAARRRLRSALPGRPGRVHRRADA